MISPPHEKATLPTYSESQALAEPSRVHHPTDLDNPEYEEDSRRLPPGWIRQWDSRTENYFYVDTTANPPRSVWEHPDDLVEEQELVPIAPSHPIRREKVEAGIPFEDSPRTIPPNQHTPLLGPSGFVLPVRRKKCCGPIGLLIRLIFNHVHSGSGSGDSSTSRVYVPPTYTMSRCAQRRAERRARWLERREQYRVRGDARRGCGRPKDAYVYSSKKRGCC